MIVLSDVSKTLWDAGGQRVVLDHASAVFGAGERIGILAGPGAEKAVLARMLCGVEPPCSGVIAPQGRVSWPLGSVGAFHPDLGVAQNVLSLAQLAGENGEEMLAFVEGWPGLAALVSREMASISPAERAQIGLACSMSVACDTYVADELAGVPTGAQASAVEARMLQRLEGNALILISQNSNLIRKWCDRFFVFIRGGLWPVYDVSLAVEILRQASTDMVARTKKEVAHEAI